MIRIGFSPFLECSSAGDKRFSAFFARIKGRGNRTIEEIYQGSKLIGGRTALSILEAKGVKAENATEVNALYKQLWREYFEENPQFYYLIREYNGFSDKFGKAGSACQALEVFEIYLQELKVHPRSRKDSVLWLLYTAQREYGKYVVKRNSLLCEVVIDRSSRYGNPYKLARDTPEERVKVLTDFYLDIYARLEGGTLKKQDIAALKGKHLGCHCSEGSTEYNPKTFCHGHILSFLSNAYVK